MHRSSPAEVTDRRWSGRHLGAVLVVLVSGLLCTFGMAGAAAHSSDMSGMSEMSAMSMTGDAAGQPDDSSMSSCDGMCTSGVDLCTVAATVGLPLLLALLLGGFRDTFLGLHARATTVRRPRRRDLWPRPAPTCTQLCVLRV